MIRTTLIVDSNTVSFTVPQEYIGKELQVIAFTKDEGLDLSPRKEKPSFTALSINTMGFKFNRSEANER